MPEYLPADLRATLRRQLPDYKIRQVARLGAGQENVAYEVNGELVVRQSQETDPATRADVVRREVKLLDVVASLTDVPVPAPVLVDERVGVLAYRKLEGVPLSTRPASQRLQVAAALGGMVGALSWAPLTLFEGLVSVDADPMEQWREDARRDYETVEPELPANARRQIEAFFELPLPPDPVDLVFCHNDLGDEHVLVDSETGVITGVLDWTDAAIGDPAYDVGRLLRDFGPAFIEQMLAHYDGPWSPAHHERAVFYARCTVLEELAYGLHQGPRRYADAALRHLAWTFAGLG